MKYALYILMFVCAALMLWANGQAKSKGAGWGRPVAGFFGVLAVLLALTQMVATLTCQGRGPAKAIIEREEMYTRAQMKYVGEYIASKHGGAKILLITDPESQFSRERIKMMRDALEEGLRSAAQIVATEAPRPPPSADNSPESQEMMMYEYYLTAEAFDAMLNEHPECNLVVSFMGLPYDFQQMSFWGKSEGERQKMVLLNANLYDLRKAIMGGFIQAAVSHRPDIKYDINEEVPDDFHAAFEKRFVLITADNVNQIAEQFPTMFKPLDEETKKALTEPGAEGGEPPPARP